MSETRTKQNAPYSQGVYAGPLTQRATDYNGHEVIGVQVSDEAPDGACFFITLDDHMQVSIAPVIAASIMPYEPAEPPPVPEIEPQDYDATRRSLEEIIGRILSHSPQDTGELRTCALAMSELANIIDIQTGHHVPVYNGTVCTEYAEDGTPMINGHKLYDRIKEPPMYSMDLICLKCGHNYWTIKAPGCPRPICELDKTEYLDKTSCENFTPDTRDYEGRFPPI